MSDTNDERKDSEPKGVSNALSRRSLCIGVGGAVALVGIGALRYVGSTPVCRPPGGQDEDRLVAACVRCQRCYEVCPRHVIKPAHIEDGIAGVRTPTMDFSMDYCDYCVRDNGGVPRCVEVCPTEALRLEPDAAPETVIIGKAVIDEWDCLAFRDTGCRFCYDACPYGAIELVGGGSHPTPRVIADLCNGCGACESVCASLESGSIASGSTLRAIVVKPLELIEEG